MQTNFVQVAIAVPMRQLFTYAVPESFTVPICPGERLVVPFGNRQVVAIVITTSEHCHGVDENKIKSVISQVNDKYHFNNSLLHFLQRCASFYHHPIGDVCQQALPVLLRQIKQVDVSPTMVWHASDSIDDEQITALAKRANKQYQLFELIQQHNGISWPELRTLSFSKAQLTALENKALIIEKLAPIEEFAWHEKALNSENKLTLSVEQSVVVAAIAQQLDRFSCHLIDGITGSGKTEVYLQVMEEVLTQNKQILVLVPEIGLTPQTLSRFEQRFNLPIYLHHSGLNDRERLDTWLSAQRGNAAIIIGTRSAIFTPLHQLGLIIVDEEHDTSFKQQDSFRYHGRDIAILRAQQLNIPIILGSATPSFETLHNALSGKYFYHQLTQRAGNSRQSAIEIVNTANQPMEFGLSSNVKSAITTTLAKKEQVLVFLNRRGYAPAIHCQECHWLDECHRCNKPFTLHQKQRLLICHHCNAQKRIPIQCPKCGSARIHGLGQGTEQLEDKISELFASYNVVRIDRDSTRKKNQLAKLLEEITQHKYDLLIGTQMLAKGHHFPNVTLVVVLDVDGALFSHDFRAAEHMAQLLVQVSGRAGRASKPGKVMLQSQYPDHPLLQDLVHNGYLHYAKEALKERQCALLPPLTFQALLRAEANYPSYPEQFLRQVSQVNLVDCEMAGPMPAAIEKRAGKYRYHLMIQSKSRKALHIGVDTLLKNIALIQGHNKIRWSIDINPIDLSW